MPGHHLSRVSELIRREISHYIFTRASGSEIARASVNEVRVTPDFRSARVYVGVIGDETVRRRVLDTLEGERVEIQAVLSRRIRMRNTPHLEFVADDAIERGARILEIMDRLEPGAEGDPRSGNGGAATPAEGDG